jgi:diaminohydroxyphosphoribosylaminopyrimidine deaminase/5-amino-6-(5-phosphoribosylamino)uracil reductase
MGKKGSVPQDEHFMALACRLARRGRGKTKPNPMVGAVLVRNGEVIGTGYHRRYGGPHAEVAAFRNADRDPGGATLYVNLEPCFHHGRTPPCVDLILEKKIARVVIGAVDPNPRVNGRSIRRLRRNGIEVTCGVLEEACRDLNEVFFRFIGTGKPFVTLKAALSLDGKIACHTGTSQWISGDVSRRKVHRLRNSVDAILVGMGTVLEDNPSLTVRGIPGSINPLRVILDSRLRTPVTSKVLGPEAPTLIATTDRASQRKMEQVKKRGAILEVFPADEHGRVPLGALMKRLGNREVQHLLIEGGSRLYTTAIEEGAVDKFQLLIAPVLLGGTRSPSLFGGQGCERPDLGTAMEILSVGRSGQDIFVEGRPVPPGSRERG